VIKDLTEKVTKSVPFLIWTVRNWEAVKDQLKLHFVKQCLSLLTVVHFNTIFFFETESY
jgi:hypothetical protein